MNEVIRSEREREARAYHEFIDLSRAVQTRHILELTIRMDNEDSVKRGVFACALIAYYKLMCNNNHREFVNTEMDISEDNRSIKLVSHDKGHCINMGYALKNFAQSKGFTTTW